MASPVFAPEGASLAYKVQQGERFAIGLDGAEVSPRYEFVFTPVFSADATKIAYVASSGATPDLRFGVGPQAENSVLHQGGERFVVLEEVRQREPAQGPAWLEIRDLTFSPDGEHLAYAARSAEGWQVVLDHEAGALHDDVGRPRFDEQSNLLGYGSRDERELWWRIWEKR